MQDQSNENRQICQGMYSASTWGGSVDPHILVKFNKETVEDDSDPIVSMVIFEWRDYDLIGVLPTPDSEQVRHIDSKAGQDTEACHRKNSSAIRKRSITITALSTRLENLSWRRMQQIFRRVCFLPRQYILKIQVCQSIMESRIQVITVLELQHILQRKSNIRQRWNSETPMESSKLLRLASFHSMEG